MCLINFQFHEHPKYKLVLMANRDEFYERPTASAHFWEDEQDILAGRDLVQHGTWLGITKQGRLAALTNFRDPQKLTSDKMSRGNIVRDYLTEDVSPQEFLKSLKKNKDTYAGFNVIVGSTEELFHYNNVKNEVTGIPPGTHGLSNHFLNTPWPKVTKGKKNLKEYITKQEEIETNELFKIISDAEEAQDKDLPQTGVGIELERKLSPLFIKTPEYGTRSTTVLLVDNENYVTFVERSFEQGEFAEEKRFQLRIK